MNESHEPIQEQQHEPHGEDMMQAEDLQAHLDELKSKQSLLMGTLGGFAGALIGSLAWAIITVVTNYQISYMAIGVAYLVSYGMLTLGKGVEPIFGYIGAALALLGCIMGDFFYVMHCIVREHGVTYMEVLAHSREVLWSMLKSSDPLTLLFYAIAAFIGYFFSFANPMAEEEEEDDDE